MIVLIDNYDSFTWNLYHFLGDLGATASVYRNDALTADEVFAMAPAAVVMSPGPCTPNEAGICLDVVARAPESLPILGVCLGHQAIGQAYGGKVIRAPRLMHGKLSAVHHHGRGIFADIPDAFQATRYHSLIVERDSLPAGLAITAETEDGLIMGIEHENRRVYGVQFHPESIASEHGHKLLRNFLTLAGIN
jgi:anthranilate synthase component 2